MRKFTGQKILPDQDFLDPLSVEINVELPPSFDSDGVRKIQSFQPKARSVSYSPQTIGVQQPSLKDYTPETVSETQLSVRKKRLFDGLSEKIKNYRRSVSSPLYMQPNESNHSASSLVSNLIDTYREMDDAASQPTVSDSDHSLFSFESQSSATLFKSDNSRFSSPKQAYSKPLPAPPLKFENQYDIRDYNPTPIKYTYPEALKKPSAGPKKTLMNPPDTSVFTRTPTYVRKQRSVSDQAVHDAGLEPFILTGYQSSKTLKVIN
ncbi:hypothetical protein OGAPHI_002081 [Ogataea philodendri]|uniref:Uncharacterized protein n=1 Tax=Ogataea philodendri TaxID=1378263 RepID=A0A9P8PAA8_9ASCO|nr:uncharacterized protein OGAPHI_002081 [Ogataea philodendri]KAH3668327.1 hypothetical protein OGAPHI_002081 [Ogataea philodendri]